MTDPVRFRAALVKAGRYAQWQKTHGAEAWAKLEPYTGPLIRLKEFGPDGGGRVSA